MGLDCGKPRQFPPVARVEKDYLDMDGKHTRPELAVKVITRKYDVNGNLIETMLSMDYGKQFLL